MYLITAVTATMAMALGLVAPSSADSPEPRAIADGDGMELARAEHQIAPGTALTTFQRLESDKWLDAQAMSLDLTQDIEVDYLATEDVADAATVAELVEEYDAGPGRTAVAAINADFFDINATDAPLAPGLRDGELVQSGTLGRTQAVGIGPDDAGRVLDVLFEGQVTTPYGEEPLDTYNAATVPGNGIGVYTAGWGETDRGMPVAGAEEVTEVLVEDGAVTAVEDAAGRGRVPEDATVLLGRDRAAATLAELEKGDAVEVEYAPRASDGGDLPNTAAGGNGLLVIDGEPQNWEGLPNNATAPRTAVGFSRDGSEMHVLTVDGRQPQSGGVTLTELALMMADLGAHSALNLDGGGSTTLLARSPGGDAPELVNSPSDGVEREVPNGLVITAPDERGAVQGFDVAPTGDPALVPTGKPIGDGRPDRVLTGLSRDLTATPYDAAFGPTDATPRWRTDDPGVGTVTREGVFRAEGPGTVEVQARDRDATGALEMTVLGELDRLEPTQRRVGLADGSDASGFGFLGYDEAGHTAPIDPADVELEYDDALFEVTADPAAGGFTLTATGDEFTSAPITATVNGVTTSLSASVGFDDTVVADFEDTDAWSFDQARADGAIHPEPDGYVGGALRLEYDFTQDTGTRAAYVEPADGADLPIAGQPQSFSLWINGDGEGAWPSLQLTDGVGSSVVLRADEIDHEGWEQVTFEVPDGTIYPVSVNRFYIAETRPDVQYASEIVVDELTAHTPPDADLPDQGMTEDALITSGASADGRDWRFAVVSDAQFVARDPDSDIVASARRTLRDARASDPDFVVINGDWVDEGGPEDLEFAREMLEEELDGVPWYYVPGNHEVMGGSIEEWEAVFGDPQLTFDHEGTRFVTLDTSSLTVSGGGFAQWQELREQLDLAADDPAISSVVVMGHVPPRDTMPYPASQLTDRMDAMLLERWLADFRAASGKGVAYLGAHVGIFDSYRYQGVPYLIGGNAAKGASAAPDSGGFSGWATVGVDHVSPEEQREAVEAPHRTGPDWISVQTRPHVDGLVLDAPETLARGESAPVAATVLQDVADQGETSGVGIAPEIRGAETIEVPASYPVSTDWSGSRNLHVGDPDDAAPRHAAVLDPATGELTALRPGRITLAVTVNGETAETGIRLTPH